MWATDIAAFGPLDIEKHCLFFFFFWFLFVYCLLKALM